MRHGLLVELTRTYLRPRITGSVGIDLAYTAAGIFGGAVSFSPNIWDNAAGIFLCQAAGATVTEVAQALNVSRATVYRHANPPKTVPDKDLPTPLNGTTISCEVRVHRFSGQA